MKSKCEKQLAHLAAQAYQVIGVLSELLPDDNKEVIRALDYFSEGYKDPNNEILPFNIEFNDIYQKVKDFGYVR